MKNIFYSAVILIFFSVLTYAQQTVTITASKDNTLYQMPDGSLSNGAGIYVFAGRTNQGANNVRRAVIKFDLAGNIPANAVITRAQLKLHMSKTPISTGSSVKVHRLLADWGEGASDAGSGEGGGAASANNDATWIHKFFTSQTWTTPGGDFASTPSASTSVAGIGSYLWEDPLLRADVAAWYASPTTNFGWILIGDESAQSAKRFDSRNNSTAANRPQLIVEYTVSTSVSGPVQAPSVYSLEQNYPNPFNPKTMITYSLPQAGHTRLSVYDLLGNEVAVLVNGEMTMGSHRAEFDGSSISSGVYFYRLQSGTFSSVKKLMLLK